MDEMEYSVNDQYKQNTLSSMDYHVNENLSAFI